MQEILKTLPKSPEGHWKQTHLPIVDYIAEHIAPENMMEIGLNNGFSAVMWLSRVKSLKDFYSVDIGIHSFVPGVAKRLGQIFGTEKFHFKKLDSTLLHEDTTFPTPLDLIFVDGCHKHNICLSDMKYATNNARYVLLDDTGGKSPGVDSARKAFEQQHPKALKKVKEWKIGSGCILFEVNKKV